MGRSARSTSRMTTDNGHAPSQDHVELNRDYWDAKAAEFAGPGRKLWAQDEPTWGIWGVPQSTLPMIPDDVEGLDAVELGCGTAYVSAWLARRGARPVGIDVSPAQLATARELQKVHGLDFPLHLGNAEELPFADASFDLAISEYGAAIWASWGTRRCGCCANRRPAWRPTDSCVPSSACPGWSGTTLRVGAWTSTSVSYTHLRAH